MNSLAGFPRITVMKRVHGFTLVELMITLLLAAIILSLGVPGFRDIVLNNRAATQSNELVTALNLARSEAVKRGARVSLCPSTDQASCTGGTQWEDGWIVFLDSGGAGAPAVDGAPIRAWPGLAGNATLTGPANIRFQPLGDVMAAGNFQHRMPNCGEDQGRDVTLNMAGRALVTRVDCP